MENKFKLGDKVFYKNHGVIENGEITCIILNKNYVCYAIDNNDNQYDEHQLSFNKKELATQECENAIQHLKESIKYYESLLKEINEQD